MKSTQTLIASSVLLILGVSCSTGPNTGVGTPEIEGAAATSPDYS